MGVPTDAIAGEIGMRQEAPLAIERAAVSVETLSEEEHNVGKLLHLVSYVAVGDFPEAKRGDALPRLESLPDGLMGLVLTHLRGVVLYTDDECGIGGGRGWERKDMELFSSLLGNHFSCPVVTLIRLGFPTLVDWIQR